MLRKVFTTNSNKYTVAVYNSYLELLQGDTEMKTCFSFEWLRENCRCTSCYNEVTNQRNISITDVKPDIQPISCVVSGITLHIHWVDGHNSQYSADWLNAQSKLENKPQELLWSGNMSNDIVYVTASEVRSEGGITKLVKSLLEYGVGFVTNVEPDVESTREIIECVGPPQQTLFGGMWEFSDKMDHLDTAYTNIALDAHTDTAYFIEPAGLIIFHCIQRNCTGGKTLLVDGFRAAREIEFETPELYQCLKTTFTEFQYIEKGHHLKTMSTVINHSPGDRINQIRYNMYDRSARLPFPDDKSSLFYKSLRQLTDAIRKPIGEWWLTLEPGTVVFINNWRVLHGRSAYVGGRSMAGAYISMGNLLSRARLLGLIV